MAEADDVRELLGAYALGHLDGDDLARVEAALARDPDLRAEADELRAVADLLPLADLDGLEVEGGTRDGTSDAPGGRADAGSAAPPGLEDAVLAELRDGDAGRTARSGAVDAGSRPADAARQGDVVTPLAGRTPRRAEAAGGPSRAWRVVPVAAAALLVVGGAVVFLQDTEEEPGLGVEEPIAFEVQQDPVEVDASLVPHTWGTEVFLTMEGLDDGEVYLVDLEGDDGELVSAGTFLGDADLEVVCVMNGALLREDVAAVVITTADGDPVMRADLDEVTYRSV